MGIVYSSEHISCFNYDNGDKPTIEILKLDKNSILDFEPIENKLLLIYKGSMDFSSGDIVDGNICEGQMMLAASGFHFSAKIIKEATIVIMRIHANTDLCERYAIEQLNLTSQAKSEASSGSNIIEINSVMKTYLSSLINYYTDGLKCYYFFELKVKELLYILRAYYTKEVLSSLFQPLLSYDTSFSNQILANYRKVKTIKELAELTNYSLSGFEKHFKKVFGVSASQWTKAQKSKLIYRDINNRDKTFKEISYSHGFYSPAHFNDFCKNQFGYTPGEIRRQKLNSDELEATEFTDNKESKDI